MAMAMAMAMAMRLYVLGGLKHEGTCPRASVEGDEHVAVAVLRARVVRVVWVGWCDGLVGWWGDGYGDGGNKHSGDTGGGVGEPVPWNLRYIGTGLTHAQKECLVQDGHVKRAVAHIGEEGGGAVFFGSEMHDGLLGYVVKSGDADEQKVVLFGTDAEMQDDGVPAISTFLLSATVAIITDVKIGSEGSVAVYIRQRRDTVTESVLRFPSFTHFRRYLSTGGQTDTQTEAMALPYSSRVPPLCVANVTTTTAVDVSSRVWTSTRDPRYSRCLGRSYQGNSDSAPLPYLEESCVKKVASGGYVSAALGSDGELFLWGQACPGEEGEVDVLGVDAETGCAGTGIGVDDEQDEFVKCLDVRIDGQEAMVYDVAVGHGHVLVAAEVCGPEGGTKRVVLAAGDNSRNQLGLTDAGYKKTFEEITLFRGKRIVQLAAAGWSTYVVTLEE